MEKGIEERIGEGSIDRINKEGYLDVKDKSGSSQFTVQQMRLPVEDAYEFAKHIPNHKLQVIEGANHNYTAHREELADAVVDFITSN
uniref:Serine aminopeptidase S33 domain-containing protein n=1 Tax=Oryza barthii TaxID=65489 RepID=A0A0D3EQG9_9ORYZ